MNYSKLAKERDALGGISPELVQGQEGAGKTAGEGSCQKSAGVEELEVEVGVQINSQMTQEEKERCEELTSSVPKSPIYRRAPVGKNEEKAEKAL